MAGLTKKEMVAAIWKKFKGIIGTKDISKIGDGTVTGAISELNSNLNYKYIGSITLGNTIDLPDGWKVILAITDNTAGIPCMHFILPENYVPNADSNKSVASGYYANNGYNGYCSVYLTRSLIKYNEHLHCGATPSGAKLYVYYR